jgi:hypothetical protein
MSNLNSGPIDRPSIETPWVVRNGSNQVIEELNFGFVLPTTEHSQVLSFQWRGRNPIRVIGISLEEVGQRLYTGSGTSPVDAEEIIRWGDQFSFFGSNPGLYVTVPDIETELSVSTVFKSGQGDLPENAIPVIINGAPILGRDESFSLEITLRVPSDELRQVLMARSFHFNLRVVMSELPGILQRTDAEGDRC